jgi:nucleotide-binding universal stress UspA family protein
MLETIECRQGWGDKRMGQNMFTRILLAIDDSDSSEAAVSFAIAMAKKSSASVRVVHVNEYLVGGRGFPVRTQTEAIELLEGAVKTLRTAGIPTEGALYLTNSFSIDRRITNSAHDWSADVIVLGSRRHRRFGRFAGKGIRERVISLTALPVLAAPSPLRVTADKVPDLDELVPPALADFPSISI